jgi:hypothetical protein
MHVARNKRTYMAKSGERRVYESVLVRRTYRQGGKVRHETLANLSALPAGYDGSKWTHSDDLKWPHPKSDTSDVGLKWPQPADAVSCRPGVPASSTAA